MRLFLIPILIFVLVFSAGSQRSQEASANPAVALLAPEACIELIALMAIAVTAAYEMGTISKAQEDDYHHALDEKKAALQAFVHKGIKVSVEAMQETVQLLLYLQTVVHSPNICGDMLLRAINDRRSWSDRRTDARAGADRRVANCSNFDECCGEFKEKLGTFAEYRHHALRLFKNAKHNKLRCCFEFDNTHKALEIFDENGRHLGERGCDDKNPDPCAWTQSRGAHAAPSSSDHMPSRGLCGR